MFGALLIAVLVSAQAGAPQAGGGGGRAGAVIRASVAGTSTEFEIGAHGYRADGRLVTTASSTSTDAFAGYLVSGETPCMLGTSNGEPQVEPAVGWHVSGHVIQRTDDGWDVEFEWQRLWSGHQRLVDGPRGSQRVVLRSGDRVSIDAVTIPPTEGCDVMSVRLEATTVSRPTGHGGGFGAASMGAAGRTPAGGVMARPSGGGSGGGGAASAGGGARGTGTSAGGSGGAVLRGAPAGTGSVARLLPMVPTPVSDLPLLVYDLWLVHGLPGGAEEAQHQQITTTPLGGTFLFQPVTIGTAQGPMAVRLTGSVSITTDAAGAKYFRLVMMREVLDQNTTGGAVKSSPMPGPSDVLSFELPVLSIGKPPNMTTLPSDPLSLRVRITPAPAKVE